MQHRKSGFSLVELVVVIVIIGILAAIAVPRLSRGSAGATVSAAQSDLTIIRNAIAVYSAEHNSAFPNDLVNQLTKYTDVAGNTAATKDATYKYGPYIAAMPPAPVGNIGDATVQTDNNSPPVPSGTKGWLYNTSTGEFLINSTAKDDTNKAYNTY